MNLRKIDKLNDPERFADIPPEYVWSRMAPRNPAVLVDIGAGTGLFCRAFAGYMPDGKIYACDNSEEMVSWMKKNVAPDYPNILPLKMADYSVPVGDGEADLVTMMNLHHELGKPEMMLEESYRLLKSAGGICIVDWKKADMPEGPSRDIRFTPEKVEKQLINAGFVNMAIYTDLEKHFTVTAKKV